MIRTRNMATLIFVMFAAHFIHAQDLSSYREFQLGTSLSAIAKQAGLEPSAAKVIHERPALIQELSWQPNLFFSSGSSPKGDSVESILFSFYNGNLSRIVVEYDSQKTKGLTEEDMIEAISAKYGPATKPSAEATISSSQGYNDKKAVIALWEDSRYSFTLFHSSFQPNFGMIAVSKQLEALAQAATIEAVRLDKQEAPQREIERQKKQDEQDHAALEDARVVNKPTFRF